MRLLLLIGVLLVGCAGEDQPQTQPAPSLAQQPPPVLPPLVVVGVLETVAVTFTGKVGGGTVTGSFSYVKAQGPKGTNIHRLQPNVVYELDDWTLEVSDTALLPAGRYSKADFSNSAEFCIGACLFGSPPVIMLTFRNDTPNQLLLTFELNDPTPSINPPSTISEWGPFLPRASEYHVPCPVCVPSMVFTEGGLNALP